VGVEHLGLVCVGWFARAAGGRDPRL